MLPACDHIAPVAAWVTAHMVQCPHLATHLIGQERKAAWLARRLVPDHVQVNDLPILGEDGQHITLCQPKVKAAHKHVGRVLEGCMP